MKYPLWLIKKIPKAQNIRLIKSLLKDLPLETVCENAKCPNIGECYAHKIVTFMILGNVCTRNCRFCAVEKGAPKPLNSEEPRNIAFAAQRLGLKHVVITSVTRDDLEDGGTEQFARTIQEIQKLLPEVLIEVLIPDIGEKVKKIAENSPKIINHNLETIRRLYGDIRPKSDYFSSLKLLNSAKNGKKDIYTKSGFMVGLGESEAEVIELLQDLKKVDCDIVTIGQYLQPTKAQIEVKEFIHPDIFEKYRQIGLSLGLKEVISGPFVRSSYQLTGT